VYLCIIRNTCRFTRVNPQIAEDENGSFSPDLMAVRRGGTDAYHAPLEGFVR
jgi:hypothetical protein